MDKRRMTADYTEEIPADIICGTVSGTEPLSVRIDPTLTLTGSRLIVPIHVTGGEESVTVDGADGSVYFSSKLTAGARVAMFRAVGGEKYLIVGVIGESTKGT